MYLRIASIAVALMLTACATQEPHLGESVSRTTTPSGTTITRLDSRSIAPGGGLAGSEAVMSEITAKVVTINHKTRAVSLKMPDGKVAAITAGPEVKNLAQVKVGDDVRIAYIESVDFQVRQPTPAELAAANETVGIVGRAPVGSSPKGFVAAGTKRIFVVESMDREKALITMKEGDRLVTVRAKYPENMQLVKSGDTVVVTVSELFAADIKPVS